jgi:hypothetical protein
VIDNKILLVILSAADVVMQRHGQLVRFLRRVLLVQLQFQDLLDGLIVVGALAQRPLAGFDQPFMTHLFNEAQNTYAGFVRLFGVLLAIQHL